MPLLKVSSKPIPAVHEARDGTAMASACVYSGGYRRGDVQGPLLDELGHLGVPAGVCSCSHGSSSLPVRWTPKSAQGERVLSEICGRPIQSNAQIPQGHTRDAYGPFLLFSKSDPIH